jgi:UDP-N-acetylglucosamine diphosphorylase/glucosamine-1-phosphate N-acetyltransferase
VVEAGVEVLPGSYLEGPCFVGRGSTIRAGAALYSGCSIGPNCKVGGELNNVLLLSHANKQHEGYLGNAVLAPWVNIGAGTHNSDLKNTYDPVQTYVDGESVSTEMRFLGCCLGEHTKTSIGTMLNTGSVVGVGCNLFGSGFHPARVADFIWGQPGNYKEHRLESMIETARIVMDRRGVLWTAEYEQLVRDWHQSTAPRRAEFLSRRMHKRSG